MTRVAGLSFRIAWVSLAITGIAILIFGIVIVVLPTSSDTSYLRAVGVALVGMGIFGTVITTTAFRRRERWAWFVLWYYPVFWAAHLAWTLPPGKDHIHQVVFIVLSVIGLLLPVRDFFPGRTARTAMTS
jgi:uncharacterized membrane protein HdeD (DUF308 family)